MDYRDLAMQRAESLPENEGRDLAVKITALCFSSFGTEGSLSMSSDYDRVYSDGRIAANVLYAPDACGAHNLFISVVESSGRRVLTINLLYKKRDEYIPGEWEEHLNSLHQNLT